jgi:hypothetical protein
MSPYLNTEKFSEYLEEYCGDESSRRERTVGINRQHESWYFDIVRFFGTGAIDPSAVQIRYVARSTRRRDPLIDAFALRIADELRVQGKIYDGPQVVQIVGTDWNGAPPSLSLEAVDYADQAASFALDLPDPRFEQWGETLREYLRAKYPSSALGDSPLRTCVGVAGLLMVKEANHAYVLKVTRSAKLASLENSAGPSAAGSIEFAEDYHDLADMIVRSMGQEVEEELGLKCGEYEIRPLAYAREMFRGDRPQFFTVVETALSRSEVVDRIDTLSPRAREFTDHSFLPLNDGRLSDEDSAGLNFEARMGAWLLEEWSASTQKAAPI